MLDYPFTYNLEVEGICVAQIEGVANLVPHGEGWHIGSITLDGCDMAKMAHGIQVALAETHWLWARIAAHLLQHEHVEMNWRWDRREQEAA